MAQSSPSKVSPTAKTGVISHYLSLLPDVILVVGLGFGWYTRWSHYGHNSLLILGFVGLFVFVLNFALQYYFRIDALTTVSYLWIGCTLGIVAVFDGSEIEYRNLEHVMNLLLMSSLVCQFFCEIFRKFCNRNNPACSDGCFGFSKVDMAQLIGK